MAAAYQKTAVGGIPPGVKPTACFQA